MQALRKTQDTALALLCSVLVLLPRTIWSQCDSPVTFDEVRALRVISGEKVLGASLWDADHVLHWRGSEVLVASQSGSWRPLTGVPGEVIAAAFRDANRISVLTRAPFAVAEFDMRTLRRISLAAGPTLGTVSEASLVGGQWVLALDEPTGARIVAWDGATTPRPISAVVRNERRDPQAQWLRLSGGGDGRVFLTHRTPPFEVSIIEVATGGTRLLSGLDSRQFLRDSTDHQGKWTSLPSLPIGCGVLQPLAQRTTDERILVMRDYQGHVARSVRLRQPVGFLASSASDSTVLALRRLATDELVIYRWHSTKVNQ